MNHRPAGSTHRANWQLDCEHVVTFGIDPEYGDLIWCTQCEGPAVVIARATTEGTPQWTSKCG